MVALEVIRTKVMRAMKGIANAPSEAPGQGAGLAMRRKA